jgi:hypothetical protein
MADSVFGSPRPSPDQFRAGPEDHALERGAEADFGAWPDSFCRRTAVLIERDFPHWLVMWGPHSREFWAYPLFNGPRGTIAHSPDPNELASEMRAMQMSRANGAAP